MQLFLYYFRLSVLIVQHRICILELLIGESGFVSFIVNFLIILTCEGGRGAEARENRGWER